MALAWNQSNLVRSISEQYWRPVIYPYFSPCLSISSSCRSEHAAAFPPAHHRLETKVKIAMLDALPSIRLYAVQNEHVNHFLNQLTMIWPRSISIPHVKSNVPLFRGTNLTV